MAHVDVLEELEKLSTMERLMVAEKALQLVRQEMERADSRLARPEPQQRLAAAAAALRDEYAAGGELTIFTALDHEDFRAPG